MNNPLYVPKRKTLLEVQISTTEKELARQLSSMKAIVARAERELAKSKTTSMFKDFFGVDDVQTLEVEKVASDIGKHIHALRILKKL